jgi:hypothetical protein
MLLCCPSPTVLSSNLSQVAGDPFSQLVPHTRRSIQFVSAAPLAKLLCYFQLGRRSRDSCCLTPQVQNDQTTRDKLCWCTVEMAVMCPQARKTLENPCWFMPDKGVSVLLADSAHNRELVRVLCQVLSTTVPAVLSKCDYSSVIHLLSPLQCHLWHRSRCCSQSCLPNASLSSIFAAMIQQPRAPGGGLMPAIDVYIRAREVRTLPSLCQCESTPHSGRSSKYSINVAAGKSLEGIPSTCRIEVLNGRATQARTTYHAIQ